MMGPIAMHLNSSTKSATHLQNSLVISISKHPTNGVNL